MPVGVFCRVAKALSSSLGIDDQPFGITGDGDRPQYFLTGVLLDNFTGFPIYTLIDETACGFIFFDNQMCIGPVYR